MPARINLIGQRFEKLVVIELSDKKQDNKRMWKCQCDCGNITYALTKDLRNGSRKSCGCLHKNTSKAVAQSIKNRKEKALNKWLGSKHGYLTVLNIDNSKKECNGSPYWICKCENCGTIKSYSTSNLNQGTKSCGCVKSKGELKITQILIENNIPFEKEKRFDNCRNENTNRHYKFDFFINNQYIIEYDGQQHFNQNIGWGEPLEEIQKRDHQKNLWCKNNNIPIIRIPYTKYDTLCLEDLLLETSKFILEEGR